MAQKLTEQQMTDIQFNPDKHLPAALYTLGCHAQRLTKTELTSLISELNYEVCQRRMFVK